MKLPLIALSSISAFSVSYAMQQERTLSVVEFTKSIHDINAEAVAQELNKAAFVTGKYQEAVQNAIKLNQINVRFGSFQDTPLHLMAWRATAEELNDFLKNKPNVKAVDIRGKNAFHAAINNPTMGTKLITALKNAGVDLNIQDIDMYAPLHYVKIKIQSARAHMNADDKEKWENIYKNLVGMGARTDLKNKYDETPEERVSANN